MMEYKDEKQNLEIFAEETAEIILELSERRLAKIIRIKSKCIRFGLDDYHPKNGAVNRISLAREIGHFQYMVNILIDAGTISKEEIDIGWYEKRDSLKKWYRK